MPPEAPGIKFAGAVDVEPGGKPSRRRALKDVEAKPNVSALHDRRKWTVNANGKAFKISSIAASRTFDSKSPDCF